MTDNTLNLNTLLASIVDALATAVAAKIPTVSLPDTEALTKLIDERVSDALAREEVTGDALHDRIVSAVDEYMDDNRKIERKVDDAIDAIDWDDKVQEVLGDLDLTDYGALSESDVDDRIDDKLENLDLTDKIHEALGERSMDEAAVRKIVREELRAMLAGATAAIPE